MGRGWDGGVFSRKCVGWSFTTSIFNDLWDTNMTKRRATERSRWWDQRETCRKTPSHSHSQAAFCIFSLVKHCILLRYDCVIVLTIFNLQNTLMHSLICFSKFSTKNMSYSEKQLCGLSYLLIWDVQDSVEPVTVLLP